MYWGSKREDSLPVILLLSLYFKYPLLFYALWCWGWNSTNYIFHFQLLPVKIFLHCLYGTIRLEGRRRPRTCSLSVYESITQQQHRFQVAASKNQTHGTPLRGTRSSQTASLPLSPSFLHRAQLQVILRFWQSFFLCSPSLWGDWLLPQLSQLSSSSSLGITQVPFVLYLQHLCKYFP